MDLSTLEPTQEPVFLHLRHPVTKEKLYLQKEETDPTTGETKKVPDLSKPIGFLSVGSDSEEFRARERWLVDERIRRAEAAQNGKNVKTPDYLEVETETLNSIIVCLKGFVNLHIDGEEWTLTPAKARELLKRFKWVREFLDKEITNRENFIKG